jgi:hypothetical protein
VEKNEDYWTRQDKYQKLIEDSAISWNKLYTEEKKLREEIEAKYNKLLQKSTTIAVEEADKFLRNYAKEWDR